MSPDYYGGRYLAPWTRLTWRDEARKTRADAEEVLRRLTIAGVDTRAQQAERQAELASAGLKPLGGDL